MNSKKKKAGLEENREKRVHDPLTPHCIALLLGLACMKKHIMRLPFSYVLPSDLVGPYLHLKILSDLNHLIFYPT